MMKAILPTEKSRLISGFSLVELSIVLVILGLLVGGILSGKSLIRAAELRAVTAEFQSYRTAVQAFRDKYFVLPGDMNNATQFWGRQDPGADCITNSGTAVSAQGACDGNANGVIEFGPDPLRPSEGFQVWRHLMLAGIIQGSYTGMAGATGTWWGGECVACDYDFGSNSPASRAPKAGWAITYVNNVVMGAGSIYLTNFNNWMTIGADDTWQADGGFLTTSEAWNLDTKMDDGVPGTGVVQSIPACSIANANGNFTSPYNLTDTTTLCSLILKR